MEEKFKYMVYRVFTENERPDADERTTFYGWTTSKSVLRAFFEQRSKSKYKVMKMSEDDIAMYYSEDVLDSSTMIDFVNLQFSSTREKIPFFITQNEMKEAEKHIQRLFSDMASIVERSNGSMTQLELFVNLDEYYADALEFIGFRPPELEALFPSAEDYHGYGEGTIESIEETIDEVYNGNLDSPQEVYEKNDPRVPGLSILQEVYTKIIYSVESFIKVLRNDL